MKDLFSIFAELNAINKQLTMLNTKHQDIRLKAQAEHNISFVEFQAQWLKWEKRESK